MYGHASRKNRARTSIWQDVLRVTGAGRAEMGRLSSVFPRAAGILCLILLPIAWAQPQISADSLLGHAIQLHQSGDLEGAIREYRAYLKQVPDNAMARSNLG